LGGTDAPSKPVNSTKSNMSSTLIVREEAPLTLKITKLDKQSNKKGNNAGVKVVTKTKSVKIEPVHTLLNVKKIEPIDVFSIDADDESTWRARVLVYTSHCTCSIALGHTEHISIA
jgi:hypothetical protein